MELFPSYVKYISDLITKLTTSNTLLVTLYVTSLYIIISYSDGIKACDHFMFEGRESEEARSVISKLINLVLTKIIYNLVMRHIFKFMVSQWVINGSCYASLFMGKFEMDLFGSCDKILLIYLKFIDDNFMTWTYSEQDFRDYSSKINNFHDTVKFTFNYSNQSATFLNVNIKTKKKC